MVGRGAGRTGAAAGARGDGAAAFQRFHRIGRRRQIGGVSQTHEHHLHGLQRHRRGARFAEALQKHLPGAREHAHAELLGHGASTGPLVFSQRGIGRAVRRHLEAREPVHQLQQVLDNDHGTGTCGILAGKHIERGLHVAAHDGFEQIEHQRPVGEAEHVAHRRFADLLAAGLGRWPDRGSTDRRARSRRRRAR